MPLNAEERMRQEEYERNRRHFSRLTPDQIKLQETKWERDELADQVNRINHAISLYVKGERKEGVTLDTILDATGWER